MTTTRRRICVRTLENLHIPSRPPRDASNAAAEERGPRDAAVNIVVGAGSAHEPASCGGLAHFLEHLLFMGSAKYPQENDYEHFVPKHGGCDNAYTEWEHITFSLSIPQYATWPALDRLIHFFIAPLLLPDSIERELNSIESEFQLQQTNDHTRWQQLLCALADPQTSPFAKLAWGNLRSL
jgi:nardilysin